MRAARDKACARRVGTKNDRARRSTPLFLSPDEKKNEKTKYETHRVAGGRGAGGRVDETGTRASPRSPAEAYAPPLDVPQSGDPAP